jgi:uncharacterized protein
MREHFYVSGLALAVLLATACSFLKPHADAAQYFVLTSQESKAPASPTQIVLGVDRIELPEYLIRPEIVTRTESNQLKFTDNERWGEAIKDGFSRTLRNDLENRLGPGHVVGAPFDSRPPLVVDVEVRRFERVASEGAVLEGSWTLRDKSGAAIVTKQMRLREPIAGDDTRATVVALSSALAALAAEIAEAARAHS